MDPESFDEPGDLACEEGKMEAQVLVTKTVNGVFAAEKDFEEPLVVGGEEVEARVVAAVLWLWLAEFTERLVPRGRVVDSRRR